MLAFLLMIIGIGLTQLWANLFNHFAPAEEQFAFLAILYTAASLLSWLFLRVRSIKIELREVRWGLVLGLPNFMGLYFLQESLLTPLFAGQSAVVYTLISGLGVVVAVLAGTLFWHERMTRTNLAGVAVAICVIVLLNMGY
ncbi:MAG: hypothetical protein HC893_04945 [Chloroflexaceae bacterium]|nr:hypothetical protein [Chloroflexaceae bacterium]